MAENDEVPVAKKSVRSRPKLFDGIPDVTYNAWIGELRRMRETFPGYGDDDYLMFLLCTLGHWTDKVKPLG